MRAYFPAADPARLYYQRAGMLPQANAFMVLGSIVCAEELIVCFDAYEFPFGIEPAS